MFHVTKKSQTNRAFKQTHREKTKTFYGKAGLSLKINFFEFLGV